GTRSVGSSSPSPPPGPPRPVWPPPAPASPSPTSSTVAPEPARRPGLASVAAGAVGQRRALPLAGLQDEVVVDQPLRRPTFPGEPGAADDDVGDGSVTLRRPGTPEERGFAAVDDRLVPPLDRGRPGPDPDDGGPDGKRRSGRPRDRRRPGSRRGSRPGRRA